MRAEDWVTRQFVVQIVVSNLPWIALGLFGKALSLPIGRMEVAFILFPKLTSEYETLALIYSPEAAERYALSYANSFVLNAICFLIGMAIFMSKRVDWYHLEHKKKVKASIILIVVSYLIFFQSIVYFPSPHVDQDRVIRGAYAGFSFFFAVFFLSLQVLSAQILLGIRKGKS
ncbi:hypothetical protein LHP98_02380 [Rhodobacter sp. Har01]|uniref:hypothetical protein n=1 Tax=Rhodobacter sp. Har01 TaxID=2883999 RepID=UPI001D082C81|nr:hypothetical protein [Rhodobacter sp. Har01]MCB6176976.1 hypothetical protein [Rhodobacter sp. Har01]